jgi:xanthine dehydrogenase small subunit
MNGIYKIQYIQKRAREGKFHIIMQPLAPAVKAHEIRFFHRGEIVHLTDAGTTRTVLDWLREDAHCSGTKEGCNEGDCGACVVVVGELPEHTDSPQAAVRGLRLRTANACIRFLPSLHGKALFTVEDLRTGGALHPAQQSLVDCHGSQCGFCTPGFAMSLWNSYENHGAAGTRPDRAQLADELAGNLCRCTGYRPILDAGQKMFELPAVAVDTAPAVAALRRIRSEEAAAGGTTWAAAPRSLDELAALRLQKPDARLLAGGTDVGLWVTKQFRDLGDVIPILEVDELKRIQESPTELHIGAGVSVEAAWGVLSARCPPLTEAWRRFASPSIRHGATMGGNVANGSPIGDSAPVLMALDAAVELRQGARVRRIPLNEFYTGYMSNRMERGEFVQAIVVDPRVFTRQVRAYKISKRFDSDISAVFAGLSIALDGDMVREVRLAFGGMAAEVRRAQGAETALVGQPWNEATLVAAQAALATDFTPLADMRASASYRRRVAQNLLRRFWLETRPDAPLRTDETSVWSHA